MKKCVIVSGFSGVGKGTLIAELCRLHPDLWLSRSETDRSPRNAADCYHFISKEDFRRRVQEGAYLEYNEYDTHGYGTPLRPVLEALEAEKPVLLEIDWHGMEQVKADGKLQDTEIISVFIAAEAGDLRNRLRGRGESEEKIARRLRIAREELPHLSGYDVVILNREGDLTHALRKLEGILFGDHRESDKFDANRFAEELDSFQ